MGPLGWGTSTNSRMGLVWRRPPLGKLSGRIVWMDLLDGSSEWTDWSAADNPFSTKDQHKRRNRHTEQPIHDDILNSPRAPGTGANTTLSNDRWMASAVKSRGSDACA